MDDSVVVLSPLNLWNCVQTVFTLFLPVSRLPYAKHHPQMVLTKNTFCGKPHSPDVWQQGFCWMDSFFWRNSNLASCQCGQPETEKFPYHSNHLHEEIRNETEKKQNNKWTRQKNTTTKSYTNDSQFNLKLKRSNVNVARPNRRNKKKKQSPRPILATL